ncbi:hypothetical protein GM415_11100 [Pseudodesulfovibrio cashew]|uniref:Putative Flp pilus-assembly TadG-like N-terminal domain-containing protein n=1 Tax=Pseudodesulfovibrio cashew TaxID=2678688 RepID=A0A6I6JCW1_9BACT|nr:pilus assembly protein TadG-related protein [Pseudodesulfovibrio cashew]QGY40646.1 hypothetical protein GM415_11100 [Pseudodesulfovibrio cashew]
MKSFLRTHISHLVSDRSGVASVLVALAMTAMLGLTALAVDLGQIHLKRGALQTAADAGALAGANSLLAEGDDFATLRTIVTAYATKNLVQEDIPNLAITDNDITFLRDGVPTNYEPNQVEVAVTLSAARGNPLQLYFGKLLGVPTADVRAVSRAGIVGICSSKCVKPFVVPTKFEWDDQAAPGTKYYENGTMDVENQAEVDSVNILGYDQSDVGTQIIIKPGDPSLAIVPGQYNLVDLPPANRATPITGAAAVAENIAGCTGSNSLYPVGPGDTLQLEPGNSAGPVKAGTNSLIGEDPYAYWDTSTNSVEGSVYNDPLDSPRVAIMAFYDPRYPPVSGRNDIIVYELGAFFIESVDSTGNVSARFMNTVAVDPDSTNSADCMLRMSKVMLDSSRQ